MYFTSRLAEEAIESLKEQGFVLPHKPDHAPELPDDVSTLDDESLLKLMQEFTAWADYASAQVGMAVIAERESDLALEKATAEVWHRSLAVDPKMSVTVLKTVSLTVTEVADARDQYESAYAYRRMASDIADRFERDAQLLSRELTRRNQSEFNVRQRRRAKWEP
jgi:hypothetical protein